MIAKVDSEEVVALRPLMERLMLSSGQYAGDAYADAAERVLVLLLERGWSPPGAYEEGTK